MMTQKEKMLSGKPYTAFDRELSAERQAAKSLLFRFNNLDPSAANAIEEQRKLLDELLGSTKRRCHIEPPFRCDYGYNISLGENFYANYNLVILDCAAVRIGDNAFIAPNVAIYTAGHPIHAEPRNRHVEYAFPITIGNNVWIGGNTVINPGVQIGDNAVIGAGSVVTKDVPSNVVAVGNPCRVLRVIEESEKGYYFKKLAL